MKLLAVYLGLALITVTAEDKIEERLSNAGKVLSEIMDTPDKGIPKDLLDKAECVAVIPSMKKAGFVVGGRYGKGAVACRRGKRDWGAPVMITLSGGSFGLQIGGSAVDVVMLIMNEDGIDYLLKDKFTLGGDASVAGGPVGRSSSAETDAAMTAKILTYSRSKGLFAGLELKGAVVAPDKDANAILYGRKIEAKEILKNSSQTVPAAARPFVDALKKYSPIGQ
ncbi:MAG: lipid-binding SYLF domain-containing protein [Acidobacteriota bacterium]|nr:lipid-binding SYLF domain-containing protein [Blastocatellia bacterium]MDW8412736.1 lipid-binding SYLF domain-containing protein [Acidobacteriota bacterium]